MEAKLYAFKRIILCGILVPVRYDDGGELGTTAIYDIYDVYLSYSYQILKIVVGELFTTHGQGKLAKRELHGRTQDKRWDNSID